MGVTCLALGIKPETQRLLLGLRCLLFCLDSYPPLHPAHCSGRGSLFIMGSSFFKNSRVYMLSAVAYMGSFLFGKAETCKLA